MEKHLADELSNSAHVAFARADYRHAVALFKKLTETAPDNASGWFMLGASLDYCNFSQQAEQAFAVCEKLDINYPEAANARGSVLIKMQQIEPALEAFNRALRVKPNDPQILTNIGIVLERLGRYSEALEKFDHALRIDSSHLGALNNRGAVLLLQGRRTEALQDHLQFTRLAPSSIIGYYFSAETLASLHHDSEALAANDAALAIDPTHAKSIFSRAVSLSSLRRWDEAKQAFNTGLQVGHVAFEDLLKNIGIDIRIWENNIPDPRNIYCLRKLEQLRRCDWRQYEEFSSTFKELLQQWKAIPEAGHIDRILTHPALALPLTLQEHADLASCSAKSLQYNLSPKNREHKVFTHQKLRICYVSPDYREHPTTHLMRGIYALHERSQFSIYCYSLFNDTSSPLIQKEIAANCDVFRDVSALDTTAIENLIRQDEIDILIDLAGYTAHAREELFTSHPAPVCAAYLGYAGSVGPIGIDYYISDRVACTDEQATFFTEKLVTMPRACFCYNNLQKIAPALPRTTYGLPPTGFVFCCLNNSWKLEPTVFDSWMRILLRTPNSVLWLYKPSADVEGNLRAEAIKRGVDPQRLVFAMPLPVESHLARYQVADLFLDTFYYGGHTTALDALWAGCPVLAKPGAHYASRVSTSHLSALEMPELIVDSIDAYEDLAVELATNTVRIKAVRKKLIDKRDKTSLFDTSDFVRNLERAYHAMWQRHQAGLPPAPIHLS